MPVVDLVALVRGLPPDSATARAELGDMAHWGPHEENTARFLDVMNSWLEYEYSRWTTDPEDQEFQAEMRARKRAGIKPPPHPVIMPVAMRPESLAAARLEQYIEESTRHQMSTDRGPHMVSKAEFDAALGL
jgi:hypothetical protein